MQFASAFVQGQTQIVTFFKTGKTEDPDGSANTWQVPARGSCSWT